MDQTFSYMSAILVCMNEFIVLEVINKKFMFIIKPGGHMTTFENQTGAFYFHNFQTWTSFPQDFAHKEIIHHKRSLHL